MTDVSQFSAPDFDPRQWINAACASAPAEESLERHLAGLEMRLSLAGEDLEASLVDASDRALRCIPAAAAEANRLQEDVAALQGALQRQVAQLAELRAASVRSTGTLAVLNGVKSRMEAACTTLKEATELSELFKRVDTVFAGGDVAEMAALLARMRASLALVGHVPEFAGGLQRLSALEDRFQGMVEGSLAAAFAERRGKDVAQLGAMMRSVGRGAAVQKLFLAARAQPLQAQWDAFDPNSPGGFPDWLPVFYGSVESATENEVRWLAPVLPAQAAELAGALAAAVFTKIDKSFRMRLNNALESARDQVEGPLLTLAQLHVGAVATVHGIAAALVEAQPSQLQKIASAAYQPFEGHMSRYGEMESRQLAAELAYIHLPDASRQHSSDGMLGNGRDDSSLPQSMTNSEAADIEAAVSALAASSGPAVAAVQAAAGRAWDITGGTELPQLLKAADAAMAAFGGRQVACLAAVRAAVFAAAERQAGARTPGAGAGSPQAAGGPEVAHLNDDAAAVLPLLSVGGAAAAHVGLLDSRLRAAVATLKPTLEQAAVAQAEGFEVASAADPTDAVLLRLLASEGALLRKLQSFVQSAADVRFSALPTATSAAATFQAAAETLVYDVLMIRVKEHLGGLSEQECWAAATPNDFGLPSFSAYPGTAVAGAGEYLLMLPQLLEAALEGTPALEGPPTLEGISTQEGSSGAPSPAVDGDWLDKVAAGAATEFLAQLNAVPQLSPAGAAQAAADTEYLANVLSALGVPLQQQLATWQLVVGLPPAEFLTADTSALHLPTIEHIARTRNLPVPGAAAV